MGARTRLVREAFGGGRMSPQWSVKISVVAGSLKKNFLNVCIHRLPRRESIVRPGSRCPQCKTAIAWYDNIPIFSYLWLRGRCRSCRARIGWRYPLVEALNAAGYGFIVWRFGVIPMGLVYGALFSALIVASFIDLDHMIVPDRITLPGIALGLVAGTLLLPRWGDSVGGLVLGAGLLYVMAWISPYLFGKEGRGGGDIKLLARIGAFRGASGSAGLDTATALLLRVLGAIILLMLLYSVFARVVRRDSSPSTGFVKDDVFLDVVARLRGKEHELERLRSAAEERAREIESYNENILRSVSSGVITFNPEGVVTTFNDAAGRILRLTQEDVIGKTCDEVFGANSTVAGLLKRCLSTGEAITREEFELRLPHGGRFWIGVSTTLLKDREGRLIGTTFVCTDLTEIKALQEQVEMRERMTVLGQMSAAIAHEFRNLMGTILGAAKLIARQTPTANPVHESIQTITHVIADMDHLITQFLNFVRKTELDLKPVDMEPCLKRMLEQVLEQVPLPHPQVEVTCFPDVSH